MTSTVTSNPFELSSVLPPPLMAFDQASTDVSPITSSCPSPLHLPLRLNSQMFSPKSVFCYHNLINSLETQRDEIMPKPDLLRRRRKSLPMRSPKSAFDVYDTPGVVFTCDSSSIKVKHKPLDFTTEYRSALDSSSSPELFPVCDENAISNERKNAGHRRNSLKKSTGIRVCASCGVSKTPYWREAWNGNFLCNACGLRYAKFKKRCGKCNYVPRKDDKCNKDCPICRTEWI
ncbi:hypothetical protein ROZALSC1DRAFT_21551 [Rozella allomycis CSF55]|uniref:GATA-type domain-containing protein n=1 Tax=Rozella allomycis (strain CSF55) TaxID=988480 RepID=A0A4P9YNP1_ROZAC|nr:hypothetical protein ROZALSC1DRAFT_21551 [Rozella allomycis CSF55]